MAGKGALAQSILSVKGLSGFTYDSLATLAIHKTY
ncbi:hypothetical protein J2X83_000629 [Brevibacillus nitrificans]|nr:hypothetical protein [Brevibacillus nitrificans]